MATPDINSERRDYAAIRREQMLRKEEKDYDNQKRELAKEGKLQSNGTHAAAPAAAAAEKKKRRWDQTAEDTPTVRD